MAATVVPHTTRAAGPTRWIGLTAAVAAGVLIAALPAPHGLARPAQFILAIAAFTAIVWAFQVINNGVASILMIALLILAGVRAPLALSGFGSAPFWVLLTVLYYGFAMKKTGLAERLSYYILSLFPGTYPGILCAFFIIGFVLGLGIPSITVRTAIMTPIAWALVQSLGLPHRSRGSALIVLTAIEMAVIPGLAVLYGSLMGPLAAAAFEIKHLPLSWIGYARVVTFPTLLLCALILVGNQIILRPEAPLDAPADFAKDRLKALGPLARAELVTTVVVVLSILFWATDRYHHLPAFLIGMLAMAVFAIEGILRDEDMGTGVSWTLLLFLGGIFSLANVIQEYKITEWLAAFFVPVARSLTFSPLIAILAMAIAMFLLRFVEPSSFIALPVLFLSVVDVTSAAGIPPVVLMTPILLASVPFWMSYQNFWFAMGEGITAQEAFGGSQRARIATAYAVFTLVSLTVAVGFWKLTGVLK